MKDVLTIVKPNPKMNLLQSADSKGTLQLPCIMSKAGYQITPLLCTRQPWRKGSATVLGVSYFPDVGCSSTYYFCDGGF